jgi:hypothetical protein
MENSKNQAMCKTGLMLKALAQSVKVKVIQQINSLVFKYTTFISIIYEFFKNHGTSSPF